MNNGLFTYLAALLLFGSNGIIAAAIALPSSAIVLLRTFLGALSLVAILAITQRHKLQAPSRPREAAALLLSGVALGASWIFLFRAYQTIGIGISSLLYYCGPIIVMALSPLIFGEKLTGGKIAGLYRRCLRCFSHCSARSRWQYAHCGYRLRHRLGLLLCADGHR